jgi:hypothetical protein
MDNSENRGHLTQIRFGEHVAYVEVAPLPGVDEEEVAGHLLSFDGFTDSLRAITTTVSDAVTAGLSNVKPNKIAVEFGCEVGVESGKLTAVLVKGSAKANIKVVAEWTPKA